MQIARLRRGALRVMRAGGNAPPEFIDGPDGVLIALFRHADQEVQLPGPLIDRADLDA